MIRFLSLSFRIAYHRAAMRHLCASHPDVPWITLHLMNFTDQRNALFARWNI